MFQGDNDRVKLMVLFCGDEDEKVVLAASGCLATLSDDEKICQKIISVSYSLPPSLPPSLPLSPPPMQTGHYSMERTYAATSPV